MRNRQETAVQWLTRIGRHDMVDCYERLRHLLLLNGSSERRSLWDLLAGIRSFHPGTCTTVLVRYEERFEFDVYAEACEYRGVKVKEGALFAGARPHAHRVPQVKKWGDELRHLVKG